MIDPRRFLPLLAGVGLFVAVHQVLDAVPLLAQADLATPTGRVRLVTILWSRSAVLLVADIFLIAAAIGLGHRWFQAGLSRIHLAGGVLLLLAVPILLVSAGGMVSSVGGAGIGMFRVTMARALFGLGVTGCGALVGWRALSGGTGRAVGG